MSAPARLVVRAAAAAGLLLAACAGRPAGSGRPPLLLVSDRSGALRIYEEVDAGSPRVIGDAGAAPSHGDWMPARLPGGDIVFVSDRDGRAAIYVAAAAGGARRLTSDGGPIDVTAPAPLGRDRIVFAGAEPGSPPRSARDLYTLRLDGGDLRRLTRHPADDTEPWGTADGRGVVFVSDRSGAPRVWRIPDVEDSDPESHAVCLSQPGPGGAARPAPPGDFSDHAPAPLPDGSIVFSREPAGGVPQIFVMSEGGAASGLRQITDRLTLPFGAAEPVVVDQRTVLLVAGRAGGRNGRSGGDRFAVYRIALGGFNLERVTRDQAPYSDFTRHLAGH